MNARRVIRAWYLFLLLGACSFDYDPAPERSDEPDLIMKDAEYVRVVNGNPEIRLKAEEVRRYESKHIMELDEFSFEQYNAAPEGYGTIPGVNVRGAAGAARVETDTGNASMSGGVSMEVISEDMNFETAAVSWQDKERILRAPGRVQIGRSDGTALSGTGFSADTRSRSWEFESAVEGIIVEEED
ncbi:MAG: LPS export ABC transporter periplasmic protein LptC [Treponema sp.]|jgi:LPS export ABC transporter protein LptC|nr:LPS export ABC transporter periplasmic protein LptC [Treponema sp.]